MTVYIEYVIIDNIIIDYFMLKVSLSLTGTPFRKRRLFLCAVMGAFIALLYPLLHNVKAIMIAVKVLTGFLMVLLSTNFNSFKSYYLNTAIFFTFTFLTGGAIMGIFSIFNLDYSSEFSIAVMALPVIIVLKFLSGGLKFLYKRKDKINNFYKVEIAINNTIIKERGFMDTGNGVYDGDRIVVFMDKNLFIHYMKRDMMKLKYKKIHIKTVNGESEKIAFLCDSFKIYINGQVNIFNNVTLGLMAGSSCDCQLILHPALLEVGFNDMRSDKIKKVS